jgi:cytochrome P450
LLNSVAGYKTNESSLSAVMYRLVRDPHQMQKLQQELRANFKTVDEITGKRLVNLPFLNGCVQESLRLLPPLAGKFMSRRSPGTMIEGIYVPFGVQVYAETYTMQRSPRYWADPSSFKPERWYDNGPDSPYANDNKDAYKPFSSGARTCLGREMALQALRLTVAKLAFRYDFEMVNRDDFVWERDAGSAALFSKYKIMVRLSRPKSEEVVDGMDSKSSSMI